MNFVGQQIFWVFITKILQAQVQPQVLVSIPPLTFFWNFEIGVKGRKKGVKSFCLAGLNVNQNPQSSPVRKSSVLNRVSLYRDGSPSGGAPLPQRLAIQLLLAREDRRRVSDDLHLYPVTPRLRTQLLSPRTLEADLRAWFFAFKIVIPTVKLLWNLKEVDFFLQMFGRWGMYWNWTAT